MTNIGPRAKFPLSERTFRLKVTRGEKKNKTNTKTMTTQKEAAKNAAYEAAMQIVHGGLLSNDQPKPTVEDVAQIIIDKAISKITATNLTITP